MPAHLAQTPQRRPLELGISNCRYRGLLVVVLQRDSNFIIFFITKEKQEALTQYQNSFEDGVLEIEGETNNMADNRIVHADENGNEIHLFYRDLHHSPFVYHGQVFLTNFTLNTDKPSHFRFAGDRETQSIDGALEAESLAHGISLEDYIPDPEGRQRVVQSIQHERSAKNRRRALELHGNACTVCGFTFDASSGIHSLMACHGGSMGSMVSMSKGGGGGRGRWIMPCQRP